MISTSIIIPNYNGAEKVLTLLDALVPQLHSEHEIVLVDDGSTDGSMKLLESAAAGLKNINIVQQVNKGRAVARNRGASASRGEFLIFLDNDVIPSSSFIQRIENVHSLRPKSWITGTVVQDIIECPHRDFLLFRSRLDYLPRGVQIDDSGLAAVTSFTTQQLGVSREEFFRVGGFDEQLRDCEDFDLSVRVIDQGGVIVHDSLNIVRHADYATIDKFILRQVEYRRARLSLKSAKTQLAERFPELFPDSKKISMIERYLRRLFLWNWAWDAFFKKRISQLLPRSVRFAIFDFLISSNFLLSVDEVHA